MLAKITKRLRAGETPAERLYAAAVTQARRAEFYVYQGVNDTVRGRFELVCLHAFLIFRRLKACGRPGRELAQALHDMMFADMDRSLREMGVGDMSIGKKIKQLATNLYGRIQVYDDGLAGVAPLADALQRNLYGDANPTDSQISALEAYIRREVTGLEDQNCSDLLSGRVAFGPPPLVLAR